MFRIKTSLFKNFLRFNFSKRFTKDHEWIKQDQGNVYSVGITDYAQDKLGDVVYINFPEEGSEFEPHGEVAEIESSKAVGILYAPVNLKVLENNMQLEDDYSVVNSDADNTWIYKAEVKQEKELDSLMEESTYNQYVQDLENKED